MLHRRPILVPLLLALASACGDAVISSPDDLFFNRLLEGDLRPLSRENLPLRPPTFVDPAQVNGGAAIVDEAVPKVGFLTQLRRADCFWMPPAPVKLSWELVARLQPSVDGDFYSDLETDFDHPTVPIELGACTLTDRIERRRMIDSDRDPITLTWDPGLIPGATAALTACTGPAPDADNTCAVQRTCVNITNRCSGSHGHFPLCAQDCEQPVTQATTFNVELRVATPGTVLEDTTTQPTIIKREQLGATFMPVASSVAVARPLSRAGSVFSYATKVRGDGTWDENWSPDLVVTRVRVFEQLGANEGRRYVVPTRISVVGQSCTPDAGGSVDWERCPILASVTPTNHVNELAVPLLWKVELPAPLDRPYRIEFIVGDRRSITNGVPMVRWSQASVDFGRYDFRATVTRTIFLENNGNAAVTMNGLTMGGRFTARAATQNLTASFVLPAHASLPIEITRQPLTTPTSARETGTISLRTGPLTVTTAQVGAPYAVPDPTTVLPAALSVTRAQPMRRFIVGNDSPNPIRVTGITRGGTGAGTIAVTAIDGCGGIDPICRNVPMPAGFVTVFQIDSVCSRIDRTATVDVAFDECVTPGATCGPADDWRPAPRERVNVMIFGDPTCP